jgi:Tol biopolymer transport system component
MATAKRAFEGKSRASLIAAILGAQPQPISQLRPMTPPALDRLVQTCLAKDSDDRWQTAHDVMLELRFIAESGSAAGVPAPVVRRRVWRERAAWIVAALAAVAAMALFALRKPAASGELVHFTIDTPPDTQLFPFDTKGVAISPDGTMVAFVAEDLRSKPSLYIRNLATTKITALSGTDDASYPFWSPDSRQIGFFANHHVNRIDAKGGPVVALADAVSGRGGSWSSDGTIVFAPSIQSPLYRVPAGGGRAEQATSYRATETRHRWPSFLPNGKNFLYIIGDELVAGSLDDPKLHKPILTNVSNAAFAAPDRLVFSRGPLLMTQRFDPATLTASGEATPLPFGNVAYMRPKQVAIFSVSQNGTLVFLPEQDRASRLVWVDAKGREDGEAGEAGGYDDAALSPDGKKIAVVRRGTEGNDIWLIDTTDGRLSRFTFRPGQYGFPAWRRDGRELAYLLPMDSVGQVCTKSLDGSERVPVLRAKEFQIPYDFSPDGQTLLTFVQTSTAASDIYTMSLGPKPALTPFLATPFDETTAMFSPDGKWVAFQSNASLRNEIYVRRFPPTNEQWQISGAGGESPRWSADGRELFWVDGDTIMHAPVNVSGAALSSGTPAPLFRVRGLRRAPRFSGNVARQMISGITPDNQRFLFRVGTEQGLPPINVVMNWRKALGS